MPLTECVLAVDVGGTTIKAAIADPEGSILHRVRADTHRSSGPEAVVRTIIDLTLELAGRAAELEYKVLAAGVVVPGVVDDVRGIGVSSSNIGWRDVPLRELILEKLDVPIYVGHDVRAGALAETRRGAAVGHQTVLFIPIGTGIGGALIIDGRPYSGANYAAAEIGHVIVRPDGEKCVCGRIGCLETLASASSIARRYSDLTGRYAKGAAEVAAKVRNGDPIAIHVWEEAVNALTDALITATTILDPETIVIGGGLAESGDLLMASLRRRLDEKIVFRAPFLTRALLGDEAGCVGAALFALDLLNLNR